MSAGANIPMSIPRYPDDVTREWLSTVLNGGDSRATLSNVDVTAIGTGQTGATYRVSVTYADNPSALPDTSVIKLPAQDDTVTMLARGCQAIRELGTIELVGEYVSEQPTT